MVNTKLKICITCSPGGHLREALEATKHLKHPKYYITFFSPHLHERMFKQAKVYYVVHPRRNPFRLLQNAIQSLRILLQEKPALVISTGADVTVPTCILAKLLGKKLIYIESAGNVYTPSLTGRILYHFSDLFIVQWEPLGKRFRRAIYGGPLI